MPKSSKPIIFQKVKVPKIKVPPILSAEQSLKQFTTKPVVQPPTKAVNRVLNKPLKSYLP